MIAKVRAVALISASPSTSVARGGLMSDMTAMAATRKAPAASRSRTSLAISSPKRASGGCGRRSSMAPRTRRNTVTMTAKATVPVSKAATTAATWVKKWRRWGGSPSCATVCRANSGRLAKPCAAPLRLRPSSSIWVDREARARPASPTLAGASTPAWAA
jgi:hypothetical protein